jgi:glutamate N-acetyltransferase / amino-acid N-acetyltransferase
MSGVLYIPKGFSFAGAAAGVKASGNPDLAIAQCIEGTRAAALFTSNQVTAAPLVIDKRHLKASAGKIRALIVNSGNANCATGAKGLRDAESICIAAAAKLGLAPQEIFPSSTGIIGVPLPTEKIISALPRVLAASSSDSIGVAAFTQAIMTTDTKPKMASTQFTVAGQVVTVMGVAKGAGMIHPNMATMLAYVFTDIAAAASKLKEMLKDAASESFNCISIDGDMSTNDTLLLLASGASGVKISSRATEQRFRAALNEVCKSLAEQVVGDGEGITHVVGLQIAGAKNRDDARKIGEAIARSSLVKTAWAGNDPNWGRIIAAIGSSAVRIDPTRINIFIGPYEVCRNGAARTFNERAAHEYMSQASFKIRVVVGRGRAKLEFLTCDMTAEYVRINADYST